MIHSEMRGLPPVPCCCNQDKHAFSCVLIEEDLTLAREIIGSTQVRKGIESFERVSRKKGRKAIG